MNTFVFSKRGLAPSKPLLKILLPAVALLFGILGGRQAALALDPRLPILFSNHTPGPSDPSRTWANAWWLFYDHVTQPTLSQIRWYRSSSASAADLVVNNYEALFLGSQCQDTPLGSVASGARYLNIVMVTNQDTYITICPLSSVACTNPSIADGAGEEADQQLYNTKDGRYIDETNIYLKVYQASLNPNGYTFTTNGLRSVVAHELGHYYGLSHYDALGDGGYECTNNSIMGLTEAPQGPTRIISKMCGGWGDSEWQPQPLDTDTILGRYDLYAPGLPSAPTSSGQNITFRWIDYTYNDEYTALRIYGKPNRGPTGPDYTLLDTITQDANVGHYNEQRQKIWTAPINTESWLYYACVYAVNELVGGGSAPCTATVLIQGS